MPLQKIEPTAVAFVDVQAFAAVVETGGFARAGARLGVSKSIISRRVANLERQLGARLLVRGARGTSATDIGSDYHRRLVSIFAELETAHEAVASANSEIAGLVRLTASISFGIEYLAPALADFVKLHPRIDLDLVLEDRHLDLVAEQFDLALRIGKLPDSSLIARKLAPVRAMAMASPAYLEARGRPIHPRDLADHDILFYTNGAPTAEWRFRRSNAPSVRVGVTGKIRSNNGEALREMARAGLGIALLPTFAASQAIGDGSLVVVLDDWSVEEVGLYAVMLPGRVVTARIRALVDFLAARFGPEPAWDPCWQAARAAETAETAE